MISLRRAAHSGLGLALASTLSSSVFAAPAPEDVVPPPASGASTADAPAQRLSFDAAVGRALARSPTALEAQAEVRRARVLLVRAREALGVLVAG